MIVNNPPKGSWVKGLAHWRDNDMAYLSIAFTWMLPEARIIAERYQAEGLRVIAGGPATFTRKNYLDGVAELGTSLHDAVSRHNPMATFASRGCPVGCGFCIVPAMEGKTFTLLPEFTPRPVLCDNNLSALPADYQDYIVKKYLDCGVQLLDGNSGFEPRTFDEDVLTRWKPINRGPWRFAYDEQSEQPHVERVAKMLKSVSARKKQVYVLIGNEPFASCMDRIKEVIAWGCEPYVQPVMKLNSLDKKPWVRFDWTEHRLKQVQRWANGWIWRKAPDFADYNSSIKTSRLRTVAT